MHVQVAAGRALRLLGHMALLDNIAHVLVFNRSGGGSVRVRTTNTRLVPTPVADAIQFVCNTAEMLLWSIDGRGAWTGEGVYRQSDAGVGAAGERRQLFAEVATTIDNALRELDNLRISYTEQVADVFSYR